MAQPGQAQRANASGKISNEDVITRLKISGAWQDATAELIEERFLVAQAEKKGLSVSDEELQEEIDEFRRSRDLLKAEDTHAWLKTSGLSVEDIESCLEARILASKLAEKQIDSKQLEGYYKQNPKQFEYARISQIIVEDEGAAKELALSAREEGEDFSKLAREHSLDEATKLGGGYLGLVTRDDAAGLPKDTADRIFAGKQGEIVGPFQLGDVYCVVRVEERGSWPYDDHLQYALRGQLFGQWVSEETAGRT
jgi:parvulin-like peptidyl-prolyl isomerase